MHTDYAPVVTSAVMSRKQAVVSFCVCFFFFSYIFKLPSIVPTLYFMTPPPTHTHFITGQMKEVTAGPKWQQSEWSQHTHRGDKDIDQCSRGMCTGICGSSHSVSLILLSVVSVDLLDFIQFSFYQIFKKCKEWAAQDVVSVSVFLFSVSRLVFRL